MEVVPENLRQLLDLLEQHAISEVSSAKPVRLDSGHVVHLRLGAGRVDKLGYKTSEVALELTRVEKAIIAALVGLAGDKVEPYFRFAYPAYELLQKDLNSGAPSLERLIENWSDPHFDKATIIDAQASFQIGYLVELLRNYRPDFDALADKEKIALLESAQERVDKLIDATRGLAEFLTEGVWREGRPRKKVERAQDYVRAAELADIEGLGVSEVGDRLKLSRSNKDRDHGGHEKASRYVKSGRAIFRLALGESGYNHYVETQKAEAQRWRSLPESRKWAERIAAHLRLSPDKVYRIMTTTDLGEEMADLDEQHKWKAVLIRAVWETWGKRTQRP